MNTAKKIDVGQFEQSLAIQKKESKKLEKKSHINSVQFKAVQKAVESVVSDSVTEETKKAIVKSAIYGIEPGERGELMLQVESEKIVDARHVELKFIDGGNRRYVWLGTTGQAARLSPGQVVLMKASAIGLESDGMHIKHCRISEVG